MQKYMPSQHRAFLDRITSSTFNLRQLAVALSTSSSPVAQDLVNKYNAAVGALRKFRDAHLKIACIYVVAPARKAAIEAQQTLAPPPPTCPVGAMLARLAAEGDADLLAVCPISGLNLNGEKKTTNSSSEPILGTGGTELVTLLRSCRDATTRAMIPVLPASARR
jgi:indoleamine 2,3-dioxygenase